MSVVSEEWSAGWWLVVGGTGTQLRVDWELKVWIGGGPWGIRSSPGTRVAVSKSLR